VKSQAASTGQHRLRSRLFPQASLTPPKSSLERSSLHIWDSVGVGNEGSVFECEMCEIDVKNTKKAIKKVNDCIFWYYVEFEY